MVVRTAAYRRPGPAGAPEAADGSNLTAGQHWADPRGTGPLLVVEAGGQLTVSAVSSTTKDVWSVTSSFMRNFTVTVLPLWAVGVEALPDVGHGPAPVLAARGGTSYGVTHLPRTDTRREHEE